MANRLAAETSPYLLQHATNPVDWYPWGVEALERARAEDRPILLSVGYSSCHWCHVMERESFEDPITAALMNELFVNIKVDREERPDIDQIYMKAVQAMTGGGGWPMTVFLMPDGVPYFGGTYYPPTRRHGLPSFSEVLKAASVAYRNRREELEANGTRLIEALARVGATPAGGGLGREPLEHAYRALANRYDATHGGFGRAPKFPQPVTLELLLRHHVREPESDALEMTVHTLRRMAAGGMRDHLGGGFHRYSVDARWLVPHFEKMLYDNALLARAYLDAYRVTGFDDLRAVAVDTLDYLLTDMRSPEGGFYAARDADSEGEEGTFYLWTPEEIDEVLEPEEARLFKRIYDVTAEGNFEGRSILYLPHDIDAVARAEELTPADVEERMSVARAALHEVRSRREPPFRDEKILVSWNAMAIRALAEAGATLARWDYVDEAARAAEFLLDALVRDGRLMHTYKDGNAKVGGFLDDHAALGNALLSLHGATLSARWLEQAQRLCDEILERFWDEREGTVFDTAVDAEGLILRPRDPMDNATPSGPSLAAELLTRAAHAFDVDRWREAASRILDREAEALLRYGPAFGRMLSVLDMVLSGPVEIVIAGRVGSGAEATRALTQAAHADFLSNGIILGALEGEEPASAPLLEHRTPLDGNPAGYVCRGYVCRLPATDPETLRDELSDGAPAADPSAGPSRDVS
jgi:uncharacterized protein YyaL (SSP411 family)